MADRLLDKRVHFNLWYFVLALVLLIVLRETIMQSQVATIPYGDGITINVGHQSVAVPGMLRALELAWQRHGSLPWARILEPAIGFARSGVTVEVNRSISGMPDSLDSNSRTRPSVRSNSAPRGKLMMIEM